MIDKIELTIGRDNAHKADILLKGDTISALHAKIGIDEDGQIWIVDMNSRNGTYILNKGIKVSDNKIYLSKEDIISFGGVEYTFGNINNYISNNFYIEEKNEYDSKIEVKRCMHCGSVTPKNKPCIKCGN